MEIRSNSAIECEASFLILLRPYTQADMELHTTLIQLYYLFIQADGKINPSEVAMGENMMKLENIDPVLFASEMNRLKACEPEQILDESIEALRKLPREKQVLCLAWLCVVANADGFMDREEWQFIYKLYHRELNLTLDEVMAVQKQLLSKVRAHTVRLTPVL